jgi:uncharacterized protein DUF1302
MSDRPPRASAFAGLIVCIAMFAGARAARAQTAADAGAPGGAAPVTADAGAPDAGAQPQSPAGETGGGLFEQSVAASAAGAASGAEATAAKPPFTLNGYVRGDVFVGKVPDENASMMKANYGELALQLRTARSPYGDGFAEARLRYGLQGTDLGTFVDVREAYVNAYLGRVDLRLGQQIIVWGRADALNPTNNLTPVDFRIRSPLEDDIRRGNVGARGFLRLSPLRLEGVWMPVYLPTELPPVGLPQFVSFGPPKFPSPDLRNGLVAGRVHLELAAFEMSVSYLRGYAPLPGLTLSSVTFDLTNPSLAVARTAYNQQVVGLDFSTALGDVLTIRGEAAYRHPFDYQNKPYAARPDLQYVLGADHNFGSFNLIAQYLGRYVFHWQEAPVPAMDLDPSILRMSPDPAVNPEIDFWRDAVTEGANAVLARTSQILFSQTARVQHIATLRLEWLLAHETLSISSLCLLNFTTKEWLVTPRIGYRLSDSMTAYVGAQVFAGPTETLFGLIDQQLSAGYAELRFTY